MTDVTSTTKLVEGKLLGPHYIPMAIYRVVAFRNKEGFIIGASITLEKDA